MSLTRIIEIRHTKLLTSLVQVLVYINRKFGYGEISIKMTRSLDERLTIKIRGQKKFCYLSIDGLQR